MTQEAAAAKIPINVRSLREYESGERVPNSDTVVRMSEIYDAQYLCYQHLRQTSEIAQRLIPDTGDLALPEAVLQLLDAVYAFADNKTDRRLIALNGQMQFWLDAQSWRRRLSSSCSASGR